MMRIITPTLVLALIGTMTISARLVAHRTEAIGSVLRKAQEGDPKWVVLKQLGKPWREASCGQTFGASTSDLCSQEIIYRHPLAPIMPEYWSFQYDAEGKLIGTYHYSSP